MTPLKVKVAHQIPGRIRLKVKAVKENPELVDQIKQTFCAIPGIEEVKVNSSTGSVVLYYDIDDHDEFVSRLEQHTGSHYRPPPNEIDAIATKIGQEAEYLAEHSHTAKVVVDFFNDFDRQVKIATGNAVDLKILLAAGITVFTVAGVGVNAATPVWVTLAIFVLNHMIQQAGLAEADGSEDEKALATA